MDSKKEYLLHLLIVNRSGSLLYDKQFEETGIPPLNSNELLMLASTFHAIHAISAHAIPPPHIPSSLSSSSTQILGQSTVVNSPNDTTKSTLNLNPNPNPLVYGSSPPNMGNGNVEQIPSYSNQDSISSLLFPQQHLITATPGITVIETKSFKFHCLQTPTGMKYIIVTTHNYPDVQGTLKNISIVYCDYALKNPFYELGMPVRSELFDTQLNKVLSPVVSLKH